MNKSKQSSIFILIASYADTECEKTIDQIFTKALYPERVFVGLCWQYVNDDLKPYIKNDLKAIYEYEER